MKLPLIQVTVRRDSATTTPVTVLPHEVMILQDIFGEESVQEGEAVSTYDIDPSEEFSRLKSKYGDAQIEKVFGANEKLVLNRLLEEHEIKQRGRPKSTEQDEVK